MSLLNQMLRDLDQRNAPAVERDGLSSHVRVLPSSHPPSRRRDLALLLGGLVAGGLLVWVMQGPPQMPAIAAAPAPIPAPAPGPQPDQAPALPVPPEITSPARSLSAPPLAASPPVTALKIAPALDSRPRQTTPLAPAVSPPLASVPESVPKLPPPRVSAPAQESVLTTDKTQIDKTSRTPKVSEVADAEYRKALSAVRRGSLSEGTEGLRHALQLDSRHAQARQALLSVLVDQKQWQDALNTATDGLALDPSQIGWAMIGARLLVEKGELIRAVDLLEAHSLHAAKNADYQAFQGLLLQKLQRTKEAAQHYLAAVTLRPVEGRWWYGLGLALDAEHREAEAREAYRKARDSGTLTPDLVTLVEQKLR